nr:immunoglobulin heavy chain junction region [Macaca mulatta]MOW45670.1 immunoglobulin heavy chain junction region [Macaca mulatta]MOW45708.1 immunoglobulin heavy chain junction region [Macaca mulatta]MOW45726.1 immunoglobulin heavy chain junction region [Macaca mulatta]MOW45785.1 immunoglobulin heavy chain junction region [Macaca mulatta]
CVRDSMGTGFDSW